MPRPPRTDIADVVYHVLNRANARVQIFDNENDNKAFENILEALNYETVISALHMSSPRRRGSKLSL